MAILEHLKGLLDIYNLLIIPAAIIAIVFHEVSHGYAAYLLGDNTAKDMGRLTLNPIPHIDIFGILAMIVFKFGWAKPVPVNPGNFKNRKLGMAIVALAGPVSNLILSFISLVFFCLTIKYGSNTLFWTILNRFFLLLCMLNIGLMLFNLIPISPLDGSKILYAVLPGRVYYKILQYEQYGFILLIALIFFTPLSSWIGNLRGLILDSMARFVGGFFF